MPSEKLDSGLLHSESILERGQSSYHVRAARSNIGPRLIEFAIDADHKDGTDDPDRREAHHRPRNSIVVAIWR